MTRDLTTARPYRRTVAPPTRGLPLDFDLHDVLALGTRRGLEIWSEHNPHPHTRADHVADLSDAEVRQLMTLLDPTTGRSLLASIDAHTAADVLRVCPAPAAAGLLDSLPEELAAALLRELDDTERARVLAAMDLARSAVVRGLLAWPEDSAAARMTPGPVTVRPTTTLREAVRSVRRQATEAFAHGSVYVTNPVGGRPGEAAEALIGVVAFQDLVLADQDLLVADVMRVEVVAVDALADQEEAARLLRAHRLVALPVTDDGLLLGVLTVDDIAHIVEQEATEDAERQGGSAPLDVPYLRASPLLLWRKRIVWMLVLFVAEMYTGTVLRAFEEELQTVVALTFFVPLLIGTGGNSGTQITTTIIRAMSTGQLGPRDVLRVMRKELSTGLLIALTMATAAWVRAWTLGVGTEVALAVALTAAAIVLWTALVASVLPLLLRWLRLDPAVVSGPMITTLVDGTGLVLYFTIARLVVSALHGG